MDKEEKDVKKVEETVQNTEEQKVTEKESVVENTETPNQDVVDKAVPNDVKKSTGKALKITLIVICSILSVLFFALGISKISTIRYGNIPSLVLFIVAGLVVNPLFAKITHLEKIKLAWIGQILVSIILTGIGILVINDGTWNFNLDKKIEHGNLSYSISSEWKFVEDNDTDYTYIFDDTLVMYMESDADGITNDSIKEKESINGLISGFEENGKSKVNHSEIVEINGINMAKISYTLILSNGKTCDTTAYCFADGKKTYNLSAGSSYKFSKGLDNILTKIINTIDLKSITISLDDNKIVKGNEAELKVGFVPNGFSENYKLKSSDESIATITDNRIKGIKNGKVTIEVESDSGLKDSIEVEIYTKVDSVTLDKTTLTMHKGDVETLNATINPSDASDSFISWYSSDSSTAIVGSSGKVTAKEIGTTTIKATVGGKTAECKVNVVDLTPEEYKAKCKSYSFEELARNPSSMRGTYVKLKGEVVQVIRGYGNDIALRVNITRWGTYSDYYKDTVYVNYTLPSDGNKILEDDIITIYGQADGEKSYTSTLGATITLPEIDAKYIERN